MVASRDEANADLRGWEEVHALRQLPSLGRSLTFDPATERVGGDEEANRILAGEERGYREPFVVPAEV